MDSAICDQKLKFECTKAFFLDGLSKNDLDLAVAAEKFSNNDEVVKTAIEHSFRSFFIHNIDHLQIDDMKRLLDLSIHASQRKLCLPTTPIFLINDMLTSLTIEKCSEIFCYLEDSANVWKSEMFYSSVKNYLLRMCNDLLKRLSKSQNTVFSGRIHLFLAKLFPLNEKSGLNLMSYFSDNSTRFTTNPATFEEAINKFKTEPDAEHPTVEPSLSNHSMPIDFNLYTKFWSLQEFFNKPNQCFDKAVWKTFTSNATEVLDALKSYKLEEIKDENSSSLAAAAASTLIPPFKEDDDVNLYFSKYLTSEKLLDLQLNDSNFRRQILIQFLILFQYLNADVKFKTASQVLNEEQSTWIKSSQKKIIELLRETPPLGYKFAQNVKHILEREEIWNKWKNEGCPNFAREKRSSTTAPVNRPKRAKPVCSDFIANRSSLLQSLETPLSSSTTTTTTTTTTSTPQPVSVMGKLCQVNHGNLEACRDSARQFLPTLRDFFDEAIEQLDPANQVERQYCLILQSDWAWKALRLLAKRSPHYFMQMNQNARPIHEYLEGVCNKLAKEIAAEQQRQQAALAKQQQKESKQAEQAKIQQQQTQQPQQIQSQTQQQQPQQQQHQPQEVIELEKDESPVSVRQIDDEESSEAQIEEDLNQNQNSQDIH